MSDSPSGSLTYSEAGFEEVLSEAKSYRASDHFDIDGDLRYTMPIRDGTGF